MSSSNNYDNSAFSQIYIECSWWTRSTYPMMFVRYKIAAWERKRRNVHRCVRPPTILFFFFLKNVSTYVKMMTTRQEVLKSPKSTSQSFVTQVTIDLFLVHRFLEYLRQEYFKNCVGNKTKR